MMMQEESIETINFSRISEIVEWLVENYRGEIIDWGSIGQLLIVLKNEKEWLKYVDHIE